jgi:2-dehydro-3-deoxygluconokinase
MLFAGRRAIGRMLGTSFTEGDASAGFRDAADAMFAASDTVMHVAATRREVINSDSQLLTGLLAGRDGVAESRTRQLDAIVDRIGTGDAFAAGIMHGMIADFDLQRTVDFATAAAEWSHGVSGDFLRASVADIEMLHSGNGDVRR